MMNFFGKSLVLIQVTLSILGLTWAAYLFFLAPDWGFKEARKDLDVRIPSELDKRIAATKEALRARDMALPAAKRSQDALYAAMDRYAQNHLFYRNELERIKNAEGPIQVKEIKFADGDLVLDTPRTGKPVLEQEVPGIEKSYREYRKELDDDLEDKKGLNRQIKEVVAETHGWVEKSAKITAQLQARYELLDVEAQTQNRIRFETQYLQPHWAQALEQAQVYAERRARLEQTLQRLQEDLSNKGKN